MILLIKYSLISARVSLNFPLFDVFNDIYIYISDLIRTVVEPVA